jgi:RNA polymerase-binding transcription factor DksA
MTTLTSDLQAYREKLHDARSRFINEIEATEVQIKGQSFSDQTNELLNQYILLREDLRLVENALQSIAKSNFGKCHHCGSSIEKRRLSAKPWSRWCSMCSGLER